MNLINTSAGKINNTASYRISCNNNLTGSEAIEIRKEVSNCIGNGYQIIYLDTREVINADLSGINEVIHSAYTVKDTNCQFILIFKRGSVVEKWINTTGLDKFVQTALIPAA